MSLSGKKIWIDIEEPKAGIMFKSLFRKFEDEKATLMITARDFDYSMTEIARNSGVGWSAFSVIFKRLLEKNIIKQTRTIGNAKMFKLNTENLAVQKFIKLDQELTKFETEKMLSKVSKNKIAV